MANGKVVLDEQSFKSMTVRNQNWVTFSTVQAHILVCETQAETNEKRFRQIENRQKADAKKYLALSGVTGLVGGMLAQLKSYILKGS